MTKSKYQLQIDNLVLKEDLPLLPNDLLEDFVNIVKPLLQLDPLNFCGAYGSHNLLGELQGYRALETDFRQFKSEVQQVLMPQRILHEECDSQEIFLVYG